MAENVQHLNKHDICFKNIELNNFRKCSVFASSAPIFHFKLCSF